MIKQLIADNTVSIIIFIIFLIIQTWLFIRSRARITKVSKIFPSEGFTADENESGKVQISKVYGYDVYNEIVENINNVSSTKFLNI